MLQKWKMVFTALNIYPLGIQKINNWFGQIYYVWLNKTTNTEKIKIFVRLEECEIPTNMRTIEICCNHWNSVKLTLPMLVIMVESTNSLMYNDQTSVLASVYIDLVVFRHVIKQLTYNKITVGLLNCHK